MKELKRVVVTGLGALTPVGNNVADTWNALIEGKNGVGAITQFDATLFKTQFAAEVKNFDPSALLDRKEAHRMDRFAQFSVCAAKEAIDDSGLNLEKENCERIGVIWGSGMGGLNTFEHEMIDYAKGDGTPHFNPFFIPKVILSIGAGHISLLFGLKGPSFAVSSACASSSHAIAQAFDMIRVGHADVLLTGGAESCITPGGVGGFNAMHALSSRNESPAEMLGEGMTSDAYHLTAPAPEGDGAQRVMRMAIEDAGLKPEDIDYINTHGTSTLIGDIAELHAIQEVFGDHAYKMNLDSTKSMTGHLLGATGAVEAMATILALHYGIIPPTINHDSEDQDPKIDYRLNLTFNKAQKRDIRYALSNTFGFGGHNACLLFGK